MEQSKTKHNFLVAFLSDVLRGVAIGAAFIIPGFSGGSVAAILGIYERLVGAIAGIFKSFKASLVTLVPVALGMLIGIAALILPIQWGLNHFPIPTVSLFVGLALGGLPSITRNVKGGRPRICHLLACLIPLTFAAGLSFLPLSGDVDLFDLSVGGYLLLLLIGVIGAAALVIPGISGSMLLLIFGYYNPIVSLVTDHLLHGDQIGTCILVLILLFVGIAVGFFGISVLMKEFLKRFPRGTYVAILGFILGSIPAVYASTVRASGALSGLYANPWYWVASAALLILGFAMSFLFVLRASKSKKN